MRLRCFIHGHQDLRRHAEGRMWLQCALCGRETRGWVLDLPGPRRLGGLDSQSRWPQTSGRIARFVRRPAKVSPLAYAGSCTRTEGKQA